MLEREAGKAPGSSFRDAAPLSGLPMHAASGLPSPCLVVVDWGSAVAISTATEITRPFLGTFSKWRPASDRDARHRGFGSGKRGHGVELLADPAHLVRRDALQAESLGEGIDVAGGGAWM